MNIRADKIKYFFDSEGKWLSIRTDDALEVCKQFENKELDILVKEYHPKRSLDANAYFHVLCSEMAKVLGLSIDEVKKDMVLSYGTYDRDENGMVMGCKLPDTADPNKYYPYCKAYKGMLEGGKGYICYLFYKRTRDMDSKEMAALINGTVQEAKEIGVETLTPEQISLLKTN